MNEKSLASSFKCTKHNLHKTVDWGLVDSQQECNMPCETQSVQSAQIRSAKFNGTESLCHIVSLLWWKGCCWGLPHFPCFIHYFCRFNHQHFPMSSYQSCCMYVDIMGDPAIFKCRKHDGPESGRNINLRKRLNITNNDPHQNQPGTT